MLFITNPHLRKLEAFMQEVPNFPPKGNKVDLDRLEDEILLLEIESITFNVKPTNKNSTIRKDNIMKFRNGGIPFFLIFLFGLCLCNAIPAPQAAYLFVCSCWLYELLLFLLVFFYVCN